MTFPVVIFFHIIANYCLTCICFEQTVHSHLLTYYTFILDFNHDIFGIVAMKKVKLDPVELAIGAEMIKSAKRKRELIEGSFHR